MAVLSGASYGAETGFLQARENQASAPCVVFFSPALCGQRLSFSRSVLPLFSLCWCADLRRMFPVALLSRGLFLFFFGPPMHSLSRFLPDFISYQRRELFEVRSSLLFWDQHFSR